MMRTNIVLDDELINEAMELSGSKAKKDVVHEALRLYVRFKKRKDLTELVGRVQLRQDFNHKKFREVR